MITFSMPKATCTNAYILVNTLAGVLMGLPSMLAPVASSLSPNFLVWVGVAAVVVNGSIAIYQKNVELAAQAALAAPSA